MSRVTGLLRAAAAGLVLASALVLAGCSGPVPDLSASAADQLQVGVLAVAQAAAAEQYDAAAAALIEVRTALEAAVGAGEVSAARYRTIDEALVVTETELAAALAAQQAQLAAEEAAAAAEAAAAEQAKDDDDKPDTEGRGNSGKNDD